MEQVLNSGGDNTAQSGDLIKDVTIETFQKDVIEASMTTPVVVDFWATWCGPCKQLTPLLEKAITEAKGAVTLAKIDIDKNQTLAQQLRIQSVPTVYGFSGGSFNRTISLNIGPAVAKFNTAHLPLPLSV